jgi:hypothetical protein
MASTWGSSWGTSWGNSWDGATPPPIVPTVDGGEGISERDIRDLQRAAERERADRERTYAQRKRDQADLRKALETAWDGVKEDTPEVFTEAAPEVDFESKKVNWAPLIRDHDAILRIVMDLETKLAAQQEAQRQIVIKAAILAEQQRQFEDDEAVALIFLAA